MSKFDVSTEKGLDGFNSFMSDKSYIEGFSFSDADKTVFDKFSGTPDASKAPHAYRWYIHVAAKTGQMIATAPQPTPVPAPPANPASAPAASPSPAAPPAPAPTPSPAPAPAPAEETPAELEEERRMVAIMVKPVDGVDPEGLYKKITETITSQPEYKIKWDDKCKVDNGKIYASFTIAVEADFHEEVMEPIEYMEDEVADQQVTYQAAME